MAEGRRRVRPRLSEEEMKPIVDGYRAGASIRDLARRHGHSYSRIRNVLIYKRLRLRSQGGNSPYRRRAS